MRATIAVACVLVTALCSFSGCCGPRRQEQLLHEEEVKQLISTIVLGDEDTREAAVRRLSSLGEEGLKTAISLMCRVPTEDLEETLDEEVPSERDTYAIALAHLPMAEILPVVRELYWAQEGDNPRGAMARLLLIMPEKSLEVTDFFFEVSLARCATRKRATEQAMHEITVALSACLNTVEVERPISGTGYNDRVEYGTWAIAWYVANRQYLTWSDSKHRFVVDTAARESGRPTDGERVGTSNTVDIESERRRIARHLKR